MLQEVELAMQVVEQELEPELRLNPAWHEVQAEGLVVEHVAQG
jgi:hypothetical protein